MADEQPLAPKQEAPTLEQLLLHAGQLQFNIEAMKAAIQGVNQMINALNEEKLKNAQPEAQPAQA